MSTKFRVVEGFKGELVLPSLEGRMLTGGSFVNLNDDQLKNPNIKMAIRSGMLINQDEIVVPVEAKIETTVVPIEAAPKKRGRPRKNPLEAIEEMEIPEVDEIEIKIPEIVEKVKIEVPKVEIVEDREITIDLDEISPPEQKTNMGAWNPENGEMVGKNESARIVMSQLKGVDMGEVITSSPEVKVDFDAQISKAADALKENMKKKAPLKKDGMMKKTSTKSSKSLKPVGVKKEMPSADDVFFDETLANEGSLLKDGDIDFVDQEQDLERLKAHPVLKDRL